MSIIYAAQAMKKNVVACFFRELYLFVRTNTIPTISHFRIKINVIYDIFGPKYGYWERVGIDAKNRKSIIKLEGRRMYDEIEYPTRSEKAI